MYERPDAYYPRVVEDVRDDEKEYESMERNEDNIDLTDRTPSTSLERLAVFN